MSDAFETVTEELSKLLNESKNLKEITNHNEEDNVKNDVLKILEMLTELTSDVENIKDRITHLEKKVDCTDIRESVDKILSVKLCQFKKKH